VLGLKAAALYRLPLGAKATLPIGANADIIFGDGTRLE